MYICIYIYIYIIYIYIYINVSRKSSKCVYIKRKLRTHFFLQIFWCLYEIFYSVYGSNILQKDELRAIIKSKLNEIKMQKKKLKTHCIYCPLENKFLIRGINYFIA